MSFVIDLEPAVDHPAFAGHFPGNPILPGAALLDLGVRALEQGGLLRAGGLQIASAKFFSPIVPGESLQFEHEQLANGSISFVIRTSARAVASGLLVPC